MGTYTAKKPFKTYKLRKETVSVGLPRVEKDFGRKRIKNAHLSSVPTRMELFTCKKYDFLIEKSLPSLSTSYFAPLRKRNRVSSLNCAPGNSMNAFLNSISLPTSRLIDLFFFRFFRFDDNRVQFLFQLTFRIIVDRKTGPYPTESFLGGDYVNIPAHDDIRTTPNFVFA